MRKLLKGLAVVGLFAVGCATDVSSDEFDGEDVGLGDIEGDALGAENWGAALTCKTLPAPAPLKDPVIVVSLDGLTLHLKDRAGDYDKVFPIGPGKYENSKSLTITGNFSADLRGPDTKDGNYGPYYSCRSWWTDTDASTAESPVRRPVFAGLPFIRFKGAYAIHGPIDNYTNANGGTLRRGFVSHGCVRMSAEGIKELYSKIIGKKVPVTVQKEVERDASGKVVDAAAAFIGSECKADADCGYTGGRCAAFVAGKPKTCTQSCTSTCPDSAGRPVTFCQKFPSGAGWCVPQSDLISNASCASYAGRLSPRSASNGTRTQSVCGSAQEPTLSERTVPVTGRAEEAPSQLRNMGE